jgi:hypothetical protein
MHLQPKLAKQTRTKHHSNRQIELQQLEIRPTKPTPEYNTRKPKIDTRTYSLTNIPQEYNISKGRGWS